MRAIVVTAWGEADVLELQERPEPRPGPGEVLVRVAVAGVNFRDTYERRRPQALRDNIEPPFVAGIEGVGRVLALGAAVNGVRVGERVGWALGRGSYADEVVVAARDAVPIPDGVDDQTACAALIQGMTAHMLAESVYPLQAGDWVLVHAAAGGCGLLVTQLLSARGVRVIGTTSTDDKAVLAREAGAEVVLRYSEVPRRVHELTGEGVAVVYDAVGKDTFDVSLEALRPSGFLANYGMASGDVGPLDLTRLDAKALSVGRVRFPLYTRTREALLWRAAAVFNAIQEGRLEVKIGGRYALEQAAAAHRDIEQRRTVGKLLLTVNEDGSPSRA